MPAAVVDSNVLLGYRSARDQYHSPATAIVSAMDHGKLPRGLVTNYALQEVLNPIQKLAGYARAVETLDFLGESRGFSLRHLTQDDFEHGQAIFRGTTNVELTDCITVAYMQRVGIAYIYSFDDDFDRFDSVTRLNSSVDPFA